MTTYDAVVVGSGPNGLAAAVALARAGRSVLVREADESIGGGTQSAALTVPGFVHDVCSAVHPLALASPFFRTLPLEQYGLEWVQPTAPLAHPFDDGTAALLERSVEATGATLGRDAAAYRRLVASFVVWAPSAAAYLNDTLIGALGIVFSILIPHGMPMAGPDVPRGWTYDPSSWLQRARVIGLGVLGFLGGHYLAAFSWGTSRRPGTASSGTVRSRC